MDDTLAMLRRIDAAVISIKASMENIEDRVADHEARLRAIEAREDLSRRVTVTEDEVKAIRSEIKALQKIVWAIPSASLVIAAAAVAASIGFR